LFIHPKYRNLQTLTSTPDLSPKMSGGEGGWHCCW